MNTRKVTLSTLDRLAVSVEEAAEMLGIGRSTVFELIKNGGIRTFKVGKRRLVPKAEIAALLDRLVALDGK